MRKSAIIFLLTIMMLGVIIAGCGSEDSNETATGTNEANGAENTTYPNADLLVDVEWAKAHLDDENVVFVDMRAEGFEAGHIPGAVNTTWQALNDQTHAVDGIILPAEPFAAKMQELGISNDSTVVAYDDGTSLAAARLFYGLELYGHTNVKILNGGYTAWLTAGEEISTETTDVEPGSFVANQTQGLVCSLDFVQDNLENEDIVIVDTRSDAEYTGEEVRAEKGGHIPNAVHLEWKESITEVDGVPVFKSFADLTAQFEEKGITSDKKIIPYCQTNVRGAHTYFTLRLLGYSDIQPYEGSWSEWGNNSSTPIDN